MTSPDLSGSARLLLTLLIHRVFLLQTGSRWRMKGDLEKPDLASLGTSCAPKPKVFSTGRPDLGKAQSPSRRPSQRPRPLALLQDTQDRVKDVSVCTSRSNRSLSKSTSAHSASHAGRNVSCAQRPARPQAGGNAISTASSTPNHPRWVISVAKHTRSCMYLIQASCKERLEDARVVTPARVHLTLLQSCLLVQDLSCT